MGIVLSILVLLETPRSGTGGRSHGLDNDLAEYLVGRNLVVARARRTNSMKTVLSLASSLNLDRTFRHVSGLRPNAFGDITNPVAPAGRAAVSVPQ